MNTSNPEIQMPQVGRRRGRYSDEFKCHAVAAYPGVEKRPDANADVTWHVAMRPGKRGEG